MKGPYLDWALETYDAAIERQNPDGSYDERVGQASSQSIETAMFTNQLAEAYLLLGRSRLGGMRADRWLAAVTRGADFLIRRGELTWYSNGNIVLANTLTMAFAYKLTANPKYETAFRAAWQFDISPPVARWPGYGLIYTKVPSRSDGSDGSAYLTEKGTGNPGFDADYVDMQADVATKIYLLTGDPQALRLMNLLVNQLLPRVKDGKFLDTSGGSRHTAPHRQVDFTTAAVGVLVRRGGRTDLDAIYLAQVSNLVRALKGARGYTSPGWYQDIGEGPSSLLIAERNLSLAG